MAGFFKKLGQSAKSLTKMIAIKNVTKAISGDIGGLVTEAANRTLSPFMAGGNVQNDAVGNAVTSGGVAFTRGILGKTTANAELGKLGADIADSTLSAWWSKNQSKIFIGLGVVVAAIMFFPRLFSGNGRKRPTKRRY